ncbi:serine/arginine repetitive matrix protein 4 [Eucyclogobius newberryi]|uniref:serine/arginine repetitive matrix protein 4 n=1 Tax=Eucyclogobius newberryi TaxID=166745 RepID=UPI003B5A1D61
MEPACSLAVPALFGSEKGASGLVGEKQLFEKFWKGAFKAVATPRLESVIVASITARTRVAASKTSACQSLKIEERKPVKLEVTKTRNGHVKRRGHKRHRRNRSPSFDEDLSPRPKGKKKKRKSQRKRKRKRSPSHSLSPVRKKKKKKKKSSKKSKRHRYTSKKSKHSSSSLKHKRKNEQRHKKSYRSHGRRRHHYHRSPSEASSCHSYPEDRHHLQKSVVQQVFGDLDRTQLKWRSPPRSESAPKYHSILSAHSILSSKSGSQVLEEKPTGLISKRREDAPHDYDSGNDTSSPPSCKTAVSERKRSNSVQRLASLDKHKIRDNVSDSGNSVTSYASLCKTYREDSLSTSMFSPSSKREQTTLGCGPREEESVKSCCSHRGRRRRSRRHRSRTPSSNSSSRSRSSTSSRHYSRSIFVSSCSSYSRSPSSSSSQGRRGRSRGSSCRHRVGRIRDRRRTSSSRESKVGHSHKKRQRRKSYSPMKKRRRDSPSHLEARRITSARKRPIPYFRRSPSSSISVSSWSSLFSRSRSRSAPYRLSHSRSRSYSSYRSYSRSSSWNSIFSRRSRSRNSGPMHKCHRRKRH